MSIPEMAGSNPTLNVRQAACTEVGFLFFRARNASAYPLNLWDPPVCFSPMSCHESSKIDKEMGAFLKAERGDSLAKIDQSDGTKM